MITNYRPLSPKEIVPKQKLKEKDFKKVQAASIWDQAFLQDLVSQLNSPKRVVAWLQGGRN